jgi:drug/metabolite transporter (DMT)-like permease
MMLAMTLWVVVEAIGGVASRDISLLQLVWLRYVFHLLLMFVVIAPGNGTGFVRTSRPILHVVRSLLMVAMPGSFILAVRWLPLSQVMAIFWIAPVLVLIFAWLIGDRASPATWIAVLVGWAGAAGIYRPNAAALHWAAIFPLAMAASFALYIVLTRVLDRTEGVATNLFYSAAGVAVAIAPAMLLVWIQPTMPALLSALGVGVVGYVVLWSLDLAVRAWPPSRTAVFLFSQVIVARFLTAAVDFKFSGKSLWLGTALICAAMYIELRNAQTTTNN